MPLSAKELYDELQKSGIKISKSWFYIKLRELRNKGLVVMTKDRGRKKYEIPEDKISQIMAFFKKENKLLTISELMDRLEKNGIKMSRPTLYKFLEETFPEYVLKIKKPKKVSYYFKPEVIDYLLEKLGKG